MNLPRFNVFNLIHKALRTLLFDTVMQLQQADLAIEQQSDAALRQTELLLELFDSHAWHEDNFILAAAAVHAPALIADFESEHETDLALSDQLRNKIAAYHNSADKYAAGNELYFALNDFVAFNLKHMNKEEQLLNQVLWQHYTDAEILDMERNIQRSVPPEKMNSYFEWMIKGINDTELLQWLHGVKAEAPEFVFAGLLQACAQHLPQERWYKTEKHITKSMSAVNI
jgi:hypothetical protein